MSFQYIINPYYISKPPFDYTQGQGQIPANCIQNCVSNPYQFSVYNQSGIFPYNNPLYTPKISSKYRFLGQSLTPAGEKINIFQLTNGQKVAIVKRENEATIVKTFLDAGSINETDNIRGISHCIEHFLFNGSSKLENGDVFKLTGLMGASTNASTDYAKVDYYITAPMMSEENLKKAIEIQGDMISKPSFDLNAVEAEKGPICSEISMMGDNPISYATDRVIRNLFQIKSDSSNLVAGSVDTVQNLTLEQIKNHHNTYYAPKDLYTVVVGDVDIDKTIETIADNFTLPAQDANMEKYHETITPISKPVREDIKSSKTNKSYIVSAFSGPYPTDTKGQITVELINYFLKNFSTSKLNSDLKNMNGFFEYDTQKVGLKKDNPYAIFNVMEINPDKFQAGMDSYYDSIQKIQTEYLSDEDLSALKKCIKKNLSSTMCNSENVCDLIGTSLIEGTVNSYKDLFAIVESITKEDILNAANKYFDLNKISMVAVHPNSVSDEKIKSDYNNSKYSYRTNVNTVSFCGSYTPKKDNVKQYRLQNNTHLALNNTNSNLCVFNWNIDTPPIKPKNPNIPRVLQYIFDYGTGYKNEKELSRYKELNGISADIYVNGKSINIAADCLPENINQTLMLMNELLYQPKFTTEDFNKAKETLKKDLELSDKDARTNLLDILFPGYFPTKKEMLKELDNLTLDDIKEFYSELLKNASSKMVVTAPFKDYPSLTQTVINYQSIPNTIFKENVQKFSPIFQAAPEKQIIVDTDNVNQAQIYKTYRFPMSGNVKDEATFEIVNLILGGSPNSRLFMDLREKQNLAYAVSSYVQSFENTGILTMKIQTTTDFKEQNVVSYDNVEKSLKGFNIHTDKLCNELITDEELEAAKMRLKQSVIGQCQNPYSETNLLSVNISEPLGIERIDRYLNAIDTITKQDIKNAANFIFSYNPTISILASKDTIDSQMEYLNSQGTVIKA